MSSSLENISPQVLRRVAKEIADFSTNAPDGIKLVVNEEDITDIQAVIQGPEGTPYEGGAFRVKLVLSNDFPAAPPKGLFLTKIFHPNVSKTGEICVNTLKKDWKPEYGMVHVLTVVKCLLIHPNPESALNEEAGKLLLERYDDFAKHARMMTDIHAKAPRVEADGDAAKKEKIAAAKPAADKKKSLKRL
eukprot:m.245946 g.245946  ORF g.245946 m.245946 type:complete len:190 (-) comp14865_c0_seq1:101-670(-)